MKKGDIVNIYGLSITGKGRVLEGKAELIKKLGEDEPTLQEHWEVRFISDNEVRNRWIEIPGTDEEFERRLAQHESNRDTLNSFFSKI